MPLKHNIHHTENIKQHSGHVGTDLEMAGDKMRMCTCCNG